MKRQGLFVFCAGMAFVALFVAPGCGGEPRQAGELCEGDDECPAGLECIFKTCSSGPTIRLCSKSCLGGDDCHEFSRPYCEYLGGLGRTCIEKGNNPCPPAP
jgi:hypothetical protein